MSMDEPTSGDMTPPRETNDTLIAIAAAHGYAVSKRQLAEWHRAGLLPEPEQVHGERRGSTSLYPPGTAERLLALCGCKQRYRHHLGDVAWCLWWQGGDLPMQFVRGPLARMVAKWRGGRHELTAEAVAQAKRASVGPKLSRLARTIIGKADT